MSKSTAAAADCPADPAPPPQPNCAARRAAARRKPSAVHPAPVPYPTARPRRIDPSEYLLPTREAAEFAGIGQSTLRKYVRMGLITPTRVGPRRLRFAIEDLEGLFS
jgi:excisionase family DNA binding protein